MFDEVGDKKSAGRRTDELCVRGVVDIILTTMTSYLLLPLPLYLYQLYNKKEI